MASRPTDEVAICNMAADHVGELAITTISPGVTNTEKIFERHYPLARRSLIARHAWNFARKRKTVTRDSTTPPFDFTDRYQLPPGYLRLLRLKTSTGAEYEPDEYDFDDEGYLLVNAGGAETMYLYYLQDVEDVSKWSATFADLMVTFLASKVAYPITGKKSEVQRMDELFDKDYAEFLSLNAMERPPVIVDKMPTLQARRNAGRYDTTRYSI